MDEMKAIALIKSMLNKPIKEMKSEIENIKGGGAHQVFVTDANGKTAWEDRTHYKRDRITVKLSPKFDTYDESKGHYQGGSASTNPESVDAGNAIGTEILRLLLEHIDRDWIFYWDGVQYTTEKRRLPVKLDLSDAATFPFGFYVKQTSSTTAYMDIYYYDDGKEHVLEWETIEPELKQLDEDFMPTSVPVIKSARVGQIPYVNAVDENGKPTEWIANDVMPSCMFFTDDGISVVCEREIDFNTIEMWFAYGCPMSLTNNKTGAVYQPVAFFSPGDGTKRICYYRGGDYYVVTADRETKALTLSRTADLDEFLRT